MFTRRKARCTKRAQAVAVALQRSASARYDEAQAAR